MGWWQQKDEGRAIPIADAAELTKRVSALEDTEYERTATARGAVKIAGLLFERGDPPSSWLWRTRGMEGVVAGTPAEMRGYSQSLHLSFLQAEALRDWLLKEFPLEKPAVKKAVKK
jgi:hypothetical protein